MALPTRKYCGLIFLLLLLSACDGDPYAITNPYAGADLSQSTAAAAWSTAAAYGQQITATQRAEVLAQQSAALDATRQADTLRATQTAESVRATQVVQATQAMATARAADTQQALIVAQTTQALQATAARLAYEQQIQQLDLERRHTTNTLAALVPWFMLGLVTCLAAWAVTKLIRTEIIRRSVVDGRLIIERHGQTTVVDPDRMPGPTLTVGTVSTETPTPAADYQPEVTARAQQIRLAQALARLPRVAPLASSMTSPVPEIGAPLQLHTSLPVVAPWSLLDAWSCSAGLPLGIGQHGLITVDPARNPHLLIAGATGSGKSRGGLRPLIAASLATGWQVIILDRSGLNFQPFLDLPNAHLIQLRDHPDQAARFLAAAYQEILRRQDAMITARVDTWASMPAGAGPQVMIVLDEFSNLADSLANRDREELWRQARMVAAEGRKAAVHLALALQNPTYASIDLRIRRNTTPICFQVMDAAASRVVLNAAGAEGLHPGQFLAQIDRALTAGVSFDPSDAELVDLVSSRSPVPLPVPTWAENGGGESDNNQVIDAQIRAYAAEGLSLNEIQRRVYGFTGGSFYTRVKRVVESIGTTQAVASTAQVLQE